MDFSYYKRVCVSVLERAGFKATYMPETGHLTTCHQPGFLTLDNKKSRYIVWLAESLHWTMIELEHNRAKTAIRGMLQVAEHIGNLNGIWPHPSLGDAFINLRIEFEDRLKDN